MSKQLKPPKPTEIPEASGSDGSDTEDDVGLLSSHVGVSLTRVCVVIREGIAHGNVT